MAEGMSDGDPSQDADAPVGMNTLPLFTSTPCATIRSTT